LLPRQKREDDHIDLSFRKGVQPFSSRYKRNWTARNDSMPCRRDEWHEWGKCL